MYKFYLKRLIEFVGVLCLIMILSPLFVIVTILIYFANKQSGVLFYQTRIGKGEKPFRIIKFKSMTDEKDKNGNLLPDDKRLTKIGRFIRSTSIDELPQLFNILKGEMSLIGPRPLPPSYLPYYTEEEAQRHDVRPGISGWAQVNGRKNISWDQKLEYDIYYVNNLTFALDVKIFFLTLFIILKRENVGIESSGLISLYDDREVKRSHYVK